MVQSIIAAEVGYHDLALRYFYDALFVDLADLHGNTADGVHVASAGGVWSALVYGFGGMRHHGEELTFAPRLPMSWPSLTFRVTLRGTRLKVTVRQETMDLAVEEGEEITVAVLGSRVTVTSAHPVTVALEDQGPRIGGEPEAIALRGTLRADGTVITASVPHHSGRNR